MAETFNIFSIGRRFGDENQLTAMLVWLTSVVPEVTANLMRLASPGLKVEPADFTASTEYGIAKGRLDAVFRSASAILVVESKLDSIYGDDQLRKYLDWLAEQPQVYKHRALMTLTREEAPWPAQDAALAVRVGADASARRWQDLYVELSAITEEPQHELLHRRLVQDFRVMLREEGLIPMESLQGEELGDVWSRSEAVVVRFHEYFRACQEALSDALNARPHPNRGSATAHHVYRDFVTPQGELIGVGLSSDTGDPMKPKRPMAWLTLEAWDWSDWEGAIPELEATPPDGWHRNVRWWDRPCVWRYLDEILASGTFEEQRARLAAACGQARPWLESARAAHA